MKKLIFIITAVILLSSYAYPYPAEDIQPLIGRDYFPVVKQLLQQAKKSIYAAMYIAAYHPEHKGSPASELLQEFISAHSRGVKVKVVLEQRRTYRARDQYNDLAYLLLKDSGIDVAYDVPTTKLHDKLLVIDQRFVVIGSHNWSKYALTTNKESSVLIDSPELADNFIDYINTLRLSPRRLPPPSAITANVNMPYGFIFSPNAGSRLIRLGAFDSFNLYLYFLKVWQNKPFMLDYQQAADFIGRGDNEYIRRDINRKLRQLADKYKLIKADIKPRESAKITLLDYKDRRRVLKIEDSEK